MQLSSITIPSERLLQAPITPAYAEDIFANFTPDVTVYMYPQPASEISETEAFIAHSISGLTAGTNLQLVILDRATNEFLGCSGLHGLDREQPELGIWLKRSAHGHAYGLEAIGALIAWARSNLHCQYLSYPVDERNYASKRIPEYYGGVAKSRRREINLAGRELQIVEYWISCQDAPTSSDSPK